MERVLSSKKVLVTGGAGFIGTNLCESLLANDNQVTCFDDLSTGLLSNLDNIMEHPNFRFIEGSICDLDAITKAMVGSDVVLHQAALGSVPRSIDDPLSTNNVNITGFLNVLEACKINQLKRLVFASSSSVYGDIQDSPKVEHSIGTQLSPYAVSKHVDELYAGVYANLYDLELIGLRYFNVFGRRQRPDGAYAAAIPRFISALMKQESPVIYGDGEQTRDFTYIDNVIQAINLAATVTDQAALNQMYNVACGESISVNKVVASIQVALSDINPEIGAVIPKKVEPRIGDVRNSLADISKAKKYLGYDPKFNFEKGIMAAIDWYYKNL